ncbi:unnamed protein product, partial [Iphiclides podalirius]
MITLVSGKRYFMHGGYTYCFRSKQRAGTRWRCTNTSDCKAYIIVDYDGALAAAHGSHPHRAPNYHILPNGRYVKF